VVGTHDQVLGRGNNSSRITDQKNPKMKSIISLLALLVGLIGVASANYEKVEVNRWVDAIFEEMAAKADENELGRIKLDPFEVVVPARGTKYEDTVIAFRFGILSGIPEIKRYRNCYKNTKDDEAVIICKVQLRPIKVTLEGHAETNSGRVEVTTRSNVETDKVAVVKFHGTPTLVQKSTVAIRHISVESQLTGSTTDWMTPIEMRNFWSKLNEKVNSLITKVFTNQYNNVLLELVANKPMPNSAFR